MKNKLVTKDVKLAKVKFYDAEHNGIEVNRIDAYAFLYQMDKDQFVNPFDVGDYYPVFERTPYSNTTLDGEDFGTKVRHIAGDCSKSGPCFLLTGKDGTSFFETDKVSLDTLKKYILNSKYFFVDRTRIINDDFPFFDRLKRFRLLFDDEKKLSQLHDFMNSHKSAVQYKKR